jgi:ATP-binding cassette subfamily B protein
VSLDTLLTAGREETYPPDTVIIRQGELADCFYLILEGAVEAFTTLPDGTENRLRTLEAGDLFGEVAALKRIPRSASVRARSTVKLLRLELGRAATVMENFQVLQRQLEFIARRRSKRLSGQHLNH